MVNLKFNNNNIRRIPINRNNLFYSESDFQYETELGKAYLEQDMNQTIILYEVDLNKTNLDSIYGETKPNQVIFKAPVELHVVYEIEPRRINVL